MSHPACMNQKHEINQFYIPNREGTSACHEIQRKEGRKESKEEGKNGRE